MSYRERRNRKDSRGKTPDQIRAGLVAHEARYEDAVRDQAPGLTLTVLDGPGTPESVRSAAHSLLYGGEQ